MRIRVRYGHWLPRSLHVGGIVLYPYVLFAAPAAEVSATILQHEMIHVRQVRERGFFRFYLGYAAEYFRGRYGGLGHDEAYRRISFEAEAYRDQARLALTPRERDELGG